MFFYFNCSAALNNRAFTVPIGIFNVSESSMYDIPLRRNSIISLYFGDRLAIFLFAACICSLLISVCSPLSAPSVRWSAIVLPCSPSKIEIVVFLSLRRLSIQVFLRFDLFSCFSI